MQNLMKQRKKSQHCTLEETAQINYSYSLLALRLLLSLNLFFKLKVIYSHDCVYLQYCQSTVIIIYALGRHFYQKRLTDSLLRYTFLLVCVFPEFELMTFALLTQCSTN